MPTELAVIVTATDRWFVARVVHGTIERFYPDEWARFKRPTAKWARRAGERWIRRYRRRQARRLHRWDLARQATLAPQPTEQEGDRAVGSAS